MPEDDQGAIFVVVQLPGGASVGRTSEVMRQAEAMIKEDPAVAEYTSIIGLNFIDNYSQPNAGFMVVTFKPFEERKSADLGVREVIAQAATQSSARSRVAPWCRWRRRRSLASEQAEALPMCWRIFGAAIPRSLPRFCAD